ncbi:aminotransferase class IV [Paenimyroides ceti]
MVNFNGELTASTSEQLEHNRAFLYGDAVFETCKVLDDKVLFLEDHYFRLMASMRIVRMEIPMNFTMEYLEEQILNLLQALSEKSAAYRVRITCYRAGDGLYLPKDRTISFLITAQAHHETVYVNNPQPYEVELFKDFYVTKHLLSTLKTTNKLVSITAAIFAEENGYDNCLLINDEKNIIEATNANVFIVNGNTISTPPIADGCLNGIMRKQIIELIRKSTDLTIEERSVSPFELQKAEEIFLTNTIIGIQSVTKYRKKEFTRTVADQLLVKLNAKIRLD